MSEGAPASFEATSCSKDVSALKSIASSLNSNESVAAAATDVEDKFLALGALASPCSATPAANYASGDRFMFLDTERSLIKMPVALPAATNVPTLPAA